MPSLGCELRVVAAAATGVAAMSITGVATARTTERSAAAVAPSAAEFNALFAGAWNRRAEATGDPRRIRDANCVEASPGHYMCSYAVVQPGDAMSCHLMQARWTPASASTITITLAGRTGRCGTLREALRSLR
jgi:hypothetical protein